MSELFPLPSELQQVDMVRLVFHLRILGYADLPPLAFLRLRRELRLAWQSLQGEIPPVTYHTLDQLLSPAEATEPRIRKQFKKPAPGFILVPDPDLQGLVEPQQRILLPAIFIGRTIRDIPLFVRLLQQLGRCGLCQGAGQFYLEEIVQQQDAGATNICWTAGDAPEKMQPQISDLAWWLQGRVQPVGRLRLDLVTPARLLHQGRPLFKCDFQTLFPHILRRVTAVAAWHAGIELVNDPGALLAAAARIHCSKASLYWQDWRSLTGEQGSQDLGGLLGSLELEGAALSELHWLLQLGSLLQVGKGASYGAGRYRIETL